MRLNGKQRKLVRHALDVRKDRYAKLVQALRQARSRNAPRTEIAKLESIARSHRMVIDRLRAQLKGERLAEKEERTEGREANAGHTQDRGSVASGGSGGWSAGGHPPPL